MAGVGGAQNEGRLLSVAGLAKGRWPRLVVCVAGRGHAEGRGETQSGLRATPESSSAELDKGSLRGVRIAGAFRLGRLP